MALPFLKSFSPAAYDDAVSVELGKCCHLTYVASVVLILKFSLGWCEFARLNAFIYNPVISNSNEPESDVTDCRHLSKGS